MNKVHANWNILSWRWSTWATNEPGGWPRQKRSLTFMLLWYHSQKWCSKWLKQEFFASNTVLWGISNHEGLALAEFPYMSWWISFRAICHHKMLSKDEPYRIQTKCNILSPITNLNNRLNDFYKTCLLRTYFWGLMSQSSELGNTDYKYGFETAIETDSVRKGLNRDIIRLISSKKKIEPDFMLEYRLKAFRHWLTLEEPTWANVQYPKLIFKISVIPQLPSNKPSLKGLDQLDPELLKPSNVWGFLCKSKKRISGIAVDVVFDSVSIGTTHNETLEKLEVIFCSISEAVHKHPELVKNIWVQLFPSQTITTQL